MCRLDAPNGTFCILKQPVLRSRTARLAAQRRHAGNHLQAKQLRREGAMVTYVYNK